MSKSGKKRGWLWKVLVGLGIFLVVIVVVLGAVLLATEGQRREDRNLQIADVDIAAIPDGTYLGSYRGWNKFDVVVTVSGGNITSIEVAEGSPAEATDVTNDILRRVVSAQSLDVDAVSGATVTTKGLLKAVENALVSQRTQ